MVEEASLNELLQSTAPLDTPIEALDALVEAGLLTRFQANWLGKGKHRGLVLGPYKVLRQIGRGGMGQVYLAEHTELKRQVALKVVRTDTGVVGLNERFFREGRAAAALQHPNIVRVYDFCHEAGLNVLVMEYIEGRSLEDVLSRDGRLAPAVAAGYAAQAARGLQHAHERGVVHRDVKPGNLLLDGHGTVKILDMGLARFVEDSKDNLTERMGGSAILGSPDYIAPEQAFNKLDPRSDIYGLGCTLYALLIGQPPFSGRTVEQKLLAHQVGGATPPHRRDPAIPEGLSLAVLRMMAKNPDHRFQTPAAVAEALAPFAARAEPASPTAQTDAASPRWSVRPFAAAAAALGRLLGPLRALAGRTPPRRRAGKG